MIAPLVHHEDQASGDRGQRPRALDIHAERLFHEHRPAPRQQRLDDFQVRGFGRGDHIAVELGQGVD